MSRCLVIYIYIYICCICICVVHVCIYGYSSIPLTLVLIGKDSGLSTLCHSCGFACQQRVLKRFPGHGHIYIHDKFTKIN